MQLSLPGFAKVRSASADDLADPTAYRGLHAFHKYWGKKPAEPIRYLIQNLCPEGGLVVDPFLGSGISALEALRLERRFIGIDINPAAVRISQLLVSPPSVSSLKESIEQISQFAKDAITESYITTQKKPATHYVWRDKKMEQVWIKSEKKRDRIELLPDKNDILLAEKFSAYQPQRLRAPRFFTNSRINSHVSLTLRDLFTGRAIRNIEILLSAIDTLPKPMQEAMRLSLTAAAGQMSKMVFAITDRGKKTGTSSGRMEVGSWVVGYWRPEQHFEINVWDCFERRVKKLIKAVSELKFIRHNTEIGKQKSVCAGDAEYALINGDSLFHLPELPDQSVDLIITDPPHGDRVPYLELSEIWNVILEEYPLFESEIVVSNAKERHKRLIDYNIDMANFLKISSRKLSESGYFVLFFNARTEASWKFLNFFSDNANAADMRYLGCFPLVYSASSVIQDNRLGALRTDYGLVFSRISTEIRSLTSIPGWMFTLPTPKE